MQLGNEFFARALPESPCFDREHVTHEEVGYGWCSTIPLVGVKDITTKYAIAWLLEPMERFITHRLNTETKRTTLFHIASGDGEGYWCCYQRSGEVYVDIKKKGGKTVWDTWFYKLVSPTGETTRIKEPSLTVPDIVRATRMICGWAPAAAFQLTWQWKI